MKVLIPTTKTCLYKDQTQVYNQQLVRVLILSSSRDHALVVSIRKIRNAPGPLDFGNHHRRYSVLMRSFHVLLCSPVAVLRGYLGAKSVNPPIIHKGTARSPNTATKFVESWSSSFVEWQPTELVNVRKMTARKTVLPTRQRNTKTAANMYPK